MRKDTILQAVRNNFFYGLIVILPIAITFWIVNTVIDVISGPITLVIGYKINRIISFSLSLTFILLIGVIARHFIGKSLLSQIEKLVFRIPVVSTIYKSSKQIISSFTLGSNKNMEVVLVEFPRKGLWAIGYVSKKTVSGLMGKDGTNFGEGKYAVFVPSAPNPATGYLVYVDPEEVKPLAMTFEEAMKVTVSIGAVAISNSEKK